MKLRHVLAAKQLRQEVLWQTVVFYCIVVEQILDSLERQKELVQKTVEIEAILLSENNSFLCGKRHKLQNIERKISRWNKTGNQLADLIVSEQDGLALKFITKKATRIG